MNLKKLNILNLIMFIDNLQRVILFRNRETMVRLGSVPKNIFYPLLYGRKNTYVLL